MVQLSHPYMTTGKTIALTLNFKTTLFVENTCEFDDILKRYYFTILVTWYKSVLGICQSTSQPDWVWVKFWQYFSILVYRLFTIWGLQEVIFINLILSHEKLHIFSKLLLFDNLHVRIHSFPYKII